MRKPRGTHPISLLSRYLPFSFTIHFFTPSASSGKTWNYSFNPSIVDVRVSKDPGSFAHGTM